MTPSSKSDAVAARFLSELEGQGRQLARGHAADAYRFEDWADSLRAGRMTPGAILAQIRTRYGDEDVIGKFAVLLGEPLGGAPMPIEASTQEAAEGGQAHVQ